ncbi:MAG: HupE/UreJ family protein [Pseudomonadota bacterium]|nr:HupE/UreJ family protein [Gammaproteobacteria bacterium]MDY6928189.1 HupE/UreJ family protein [Pseudomonadota bacterium]
MRWINQALLTFALLLVVPFAAAHGVADGDRAFLESSTGLQIIPYIYLGAKHMVTGYDHLLFLFGVIFFLYRLKDVGIYVTLFAMGHSITLLFGVLSGIHINAYLIDAIIGLSVVYKALDNVGFFPRFCGFTMNNKAAVLVFGLFHGFGLATKLQDFTLSEDGLVANIISFNVGVEMGQMIALFGMLMLIILLRKSHHFMRYAFAANMALVTAGVSLTIFQLSGYMWGTA